MTTHGIKFSLKHAFALTTIFCVVSAISAFLSVSLLAILATVLGVLFFNELESSESTLQSVLGFLILVLGLATSGGLLWLLAQR